MNQSSWFNSFRNLDRHSPPLPAWREIERIGVNNAGAAVLYCQT